MVKLAPWPIGGCCRLTISKRCKPSSWVRVERGFRVLKSEIELAPVYHRLPPWRQNTHWLSSNGFIAIGSKSMTESCMASPP